MIRYSIYTKLLVIVTVAFLAASASVMLLATHYFKNIIDASQAEIYSKNLDNLLVQLDRQNKELQDTLLVEAYEDQFQETVLSILRENHYTKQNLAIYPFIVDNQGVVVLHPTLQRGDTSLEAFEYIQTIVHRKQGHFDAVVDGEAVWITFTSFPAWHWKIAYLLPLQIKYAASREFRFILGAILVVITMLALAGLSIFIRRFVRPITTLTAATTQMAAGNLDQSVSIGGTDEIGTLARSFLRMRDAIREQMSDLAHKNEELRLEIVEREKAEALLDRFFALSIDMLCVANLEGTFRHINPAFEKTLGYTEAELLEKPYIEFVHPDDREATCQAIENLKEGRPVIHFENRYRCKDEHYRWLEWTSMPDPSAGVTYAVARDITNEKAALTEYKRLQEQLQQSQKMEAIGALAGGIAHDFNNLLMGVLGNVSLILSETDATDPLYERLRHIETYVNQAADLTKQILGFARGGKYAPETINLNDLIGSSAKMFGRTKKEVSLYPKFKEDLWTVKVDKAQMNQVLLNLYVNAWQAMPDGGQLYIQTDNIVLDEKTVRPYNLKPGNYVEIVLTDTGIGMDNATRQRIFEPFFTTKKMGRGTGLGLASVYGIVCNHGGIIEVDSELGKGATFRIYLPAAAETVVRERETTQDIRKGMETILLVDDESMIIDVAQGMLHKLGYRTFVARSGLEAVSLFKEKQAEIDLVLLDLIMPEMGGGEVFTAVKEIRKDIKVILSSGYSLDGKAGEIMARGCNGFIQKPFNMSQISTLIREVMDRTGST